MTFWHFDIVTIPTFASVSKTSRFRHCPIELIWNIIHIVTIATFQVCLKLSYFDIVIFKLSLLQLLPVCLKLPDFDIRGISKSIRHFIRHFIRHLTVLSVTWPFYPSLDRFIRHLTISARMWISLIILIQFDHQNDYDQSSSSVRVVISTIEHPTYACNMSQRWPVLVGTQVFVIADIWICWFGRFVFVKPSISHVQASHTHQQNGQTSKSRSRQWQILEGLSRLVIFATCCMHMLEVLLSQ